MRRVAAATGGHASISTDRVTSFACSRPSRETTLKEGKLTGETHGFPSSPALSRPDVARCMIPPRSTRAIDRKTKPLLEAPRATRFRAGQGIDVIATARGEGLR
jgi:hypothetical protein